MDLFDRSRETKGSSAADATTAEAATASTESAASPQQQQAQYSPAPNQVKHMVGGADIDNGLINSALGAEGLRVAVRACGLLAPGDRNTGPKPDESRHRGKYLASV